MGLCSMPQISETTNWFKKGCYLNSLNSVITVVLFVIKIGSYCTEVTILNFVIIYVI